MKTKLKIHMNILAGVFICIFICCSPDDPLKFHGVLDQPANLERPEEFVQPGIYKGETKYFHNGIAYTCIEFRTLNVPHRIGLVFPIKELGSLTKNPVGAGYSRVTELRTPETRGLLIFDQVVILHGNPEGSRGAFHFPHLSFNFYSNSSPFKCHLVCDPEHARYRMPNGYQDLSAQDGCVPGLGLLWAPESNSFERDQEGVLLGSANDDLAFYGPMASIEVLANHPDIEGDIPLPAVMTPARYYPSIYRIWQEEGDLHITLERFVQKP